MLENEKFYIYTKLINFFIKKKKFNYVEFWLIKKKEIAIKLREKIAENGNKINNKRSYKTSS